MSGKGGKGGKGGKDKAEPRIEIFGIPGDAIWTWESFWANPSHGSHGPVAELSGCQRCGGKLTAQLPRTDPILTLLCKTCKEPCSVFWLSAEPRVRVDPVQSFKRSPLEAERGATQPGVKITELYAVMNTDETGADGIVAEEQCHVSVPWVTDASEKAREFLWKRAKLAAKQLGRPMRLVRFAFAEVIAETDGGAA